MLIKIITFNANGIRAAARKGFFTWLAEQNADMVCIQETKAQEEQLHDPLFHPYAINAYNSAEKKGYSGVGMYLQTKPQELRDAFPAAHLDAKLAASLAILHQEGRWLEAVYPECTLISLYMPSGTSGDERQSVKERLMYALLPALRTRAEQGEKLIICGDINIAHRKIDIKNWRANQNKSGFLPHERAWLDELFQSGYCDAFRLLDPRPEQYTWWSQRGGARERNVGWRIDYHIISENVRPHLRRAHIAPEPIFSDHAPLIMEYEF